MAGKSTREVAHLTSMFMEFYRDMKKDMHMVFIDLNKTYNSIPREVLGSCLEKICII